MISDLLDLSTIFNTGMTNFNFRIEKIIVESKLSNS